MSTIDVIVPNYNYGRFLGQCVASVLSQSHRDLRVLIIDNASTDNSIEIAERLQAADQRVEIVRNSTNIGAQGSFNKGISLARADYMMFLCADDWLPPDAVRSAITALDRTPAAQYAVGSEIHVLQQDTSITAEHISAGAPWRTVSGQEFIGIMCRGSVEQLAIASIVVRTRSQQSAGTFDPRLKYYDDLEMALRLATLGDVLMTTDCLAIRRMHGDNISNAQWQSDLHGFDETHLAFEVFFARPDLALDHADEMKRVATRRIAAEAYWKAIGQLASGNLRRATRLLRYSVRLVPIYAVAPPLWHLARSGGAARIRSALAKRLWGQKSDEAVRVGSASRVT